MAKDELVRIRMISGARGEDGELMRPGKNYEVSLRFARQLTRSGKAEFAPVKAKKGE